MVKNKLSMEETFNDSIINRISYPYKVPDNWIWIKNKLSGDLITGSTPSKKNPKYYGEAYPFYRPKDLDKGYNVFDSEIKLSELGLSMTRSIPEKTIMVTCIGATIGKTGYAQKKGATNQQINSIVPNAALVPEYLFYLMTSNYMQNAIKDNSSSTTLPILNKTRFGELLIPVAPLNEQKRIVSHIESLFEKIDKAQELIEEAKDGFDKRKEAILAKAFRGELSRNWRKDNSEIEGAEIYLSKLRNVREKKYSHDVVFAKENGIKKPKKNYNFDYSKSEGLPEKWVESKLDGLIYFAGRIGWKGLKANEYVDSGPILLSVYNLNYGDYVDFSNVNRITRERYVESPEIMLKNDDILLTKDGAGIGKLGYVKDLPCEATVNSSLLVIRADDAILPKYLYYFLMGPDMQAVVKERITGSTTPHLFQRDIKNFVISIPPIEEQQIIVDQLESLLNKEYNAYDLLDLNRSVELLKKSILAKAFRGELGTNDPGEESSIDLLRQILTKNK